MELHERIFELALTRSFFFPSNEPYGSVSGFYDYGSVGSQIKHKIENLWRQMFIKEHGFLELETSIMTQSIVLEASGHVGSFADPVFECSNPKCKTRVRADTFAEKEVKGYQYDGKLDSLTTLAKEKGFKCPQCKTPFGEAFMFNLMFKSGIGGDQAPAYSRPETAQGIFTAFPRLFRSHGTKLPLAAGQVGRSFRNEISPRKGLVRMREFTQMELEYFFNPNKPQIEGFDKVKDEKMRMKIDGKVVWKTADELVTNKTVPNEIFAYFLALQWKFYVLCGLNPDKMHLRVLGSGELPHYSKGNVDMEVETSYGTIEISGNAYRTDFDLSQHSKFSKQDLSVFVEEEKKKIVPHVFEVSMGVDRMFFCLMEHAFREKSAEKNWEWFDIPPVIAPYDVAVFPLMKKDGMPEKAEEICKLLRTNSLDAYYQESGSIGRRYARADEIGIPYAVTIDYDTLTDQSVTVRYRKDGKQERVKISDLAVKLKENVKSNKVSL
jgi:glycyl-tRNA synthetase